MVNYGFLLVRKEWNQLFCLIIIQVDGLIHNGLMFQVEFHDWYGVKSIL